jgi:hypothetical protein
MRVQSIKTHGGKEIHLGNFTVLVGPNNVGKSQTLRDIHDKLSNGWDVRTTVVREVVLEKPDSLEVLLEGLDVRDDPENIGHMLVRGIGSDLRSRDARRFRGRHW